MGGGGGGGGGGEEVRRNEDFSLKKYAFEVVGFLSPTLSE